MQYGMIRHGPQPGSRDATQCRPMSHDAMAPHECQQPAQRSLASCRDIPGSEVINKTRHTKRTYRAGTLLSLGASDAFSSSECNRHRSNQTDPRFIRPYISDSSKLCLSFTRRAMTVTGHNPRSLAIHASSKGLLQADQRGGIVVSPPRMKFRAAVAESCPPLLGQGWDTFWGITWQRWLRSGFLITVDAPHQ